MNTHFCIYASSLVLGTLSGCATQATSPPVISLDEPLAAATPLPEPSTTVEVVEIPKILALPGQLKPLSVDVRPAKEPSDERVRVTRANREARVGPTREGYINAIQVWPYAEGALYQVYTSPNRVTTIALQQGEELVAPPAGGDTVRWIVGEGAGGTGLNRRVNILVRPMRVGLETNMTILTNRRSYFLELSSTPQAWMASVSWEYPKDRMFALQGEVQRTKPMTPVESELSLEQIKFRYAIKGDSPPWKPLRAFDNGQRVYIQFPSGIAQGELPPLFVIGPQGDGQLVNYRFRSPYYVVDRLFGAAELRLGGDKAQVVRIERTDGVNAGVTRRN